MFSSKDLFFTVPSGFRVSNSLRFRSSASAYLNRTAGTPTDNKKWTWSGWVKIGSLSQVSAIISGGSTANDYMMFGYNITTANGFYFLQSTGGVTTINLSSVAIWRDPSAWYHWVIVYDSANATQANRFKFYVNGVEQTYTTSTAIALNQASYINSNAQIQYIGTRGYSALPFDGYLAQVNFIDGQALTPSSFGAYDTNGIWQPTAYSGSGYGNNGFYLPFSNTTSTTTLVADSSGNGNNWTPNNISLTSGTTYDSMIDSPTNYADGGNGRGNYAVLNPLDKGASASTIPSNGNLTFTLNSASGSAAQANQCGSFAVSSGKWYWEVVFSSLTAGGTVGIASDSYTMATNAFTSSSGQWYAYTNAGAKYNGSTATTSWGATYTTGNVIGVALDLDSGTISFYKDNALQGGGSAFTGISGIYRPHLFVTSSGASSVGDINFGQRPFTYTPPSGFSALNTQNLPTPTIANGAQYMAATLWDGNSSTRSISNGTNNTIGTTFSPDFVWIKDRNTARSHRLFDTVRGATLALFSDATSAETTLSTDLTAFNSDGFALGAGAGSNATSETYVGWQWKGGGTGVSNTSGSITSTVSANTSAGFSVVTYTGTGANATVGHGLGVAPSMIIIKIRSAADGWPIYRSDFSSPTGDYIILNTTAAKGNVAGYWNGGADSTKFGIGPYGALNLNGGTFVAYCFASVSGYSAFGSYTGNGSSDGPFVYTGFRPRYVMIKCSNVAGTGWYIYDTSRNTYNVLDLYLRPEVSDAEGTLATMDVLSNGFKLRSSNSQFNGSGNTMIYAAFAENPFKSSRAR